MAIQKKKRSLKFRIFRFTLKVLAWFFALTFLWVLALKWLPVVVTPLTVQRSIQHRKDEDFHTTLKWRSYEKISPELAKAVIASEDKLFDLHGGLDWVAISTAVTEHRNGKKLRGASTISQQTAKNVFCIPSRSFIRKGFEYYFTELIELLWGKRRIMEVYLNVAEMGPGIYGAEAAAQYHFKKSAKELTQREACLIAACLPNPLDRSASKPSRYISKRAGDIASLERKLLYPSWVLQKTLSEEEALKEQQKREERKDAFMKRQKEARRKVFFPKSK